MIDNSLPGLSEVQHTLQEFWQFLDKSYNPDFKLLIVRLDVADWTKHPDPRYYQRFVDAVNSHGDSAQHSQFGGELAFGGKIYLHFHIIA